MLDEATSSRAGPRVLARDLVLGELGVHNVARWTGVTAFAVYQWISRATDAVPFPESRVLAVILGASRDGVRFDISILWPPFHELRF